jgi:hypothetical protein
LFSKADLGAGVDQTDAAGDAENLEESSHLAAVVGQNLIDSTPILANDASCEVLPKSHQSGNDGEDEFVHSKFVLGYLKLQPKVFMETKDIFIVKNADLSPGVNVIKLF